jgi:hypothetical protein
VKNDGIRKPGRQEKQRLQRFTGKTENGGRLLFG